MRVLYLAEMFKGKIQALLFLLLFFTGVNFLFAQGARLVFQDKFTDNTNHWILQEEGEVLANIHNGKYVLSRVNAKGANFFSNDKLSINPDEDFLIRTKIKFISGNPDYGYGVFWGAASGHDFYSFTISAGGVASFYKIEEGVYFNLFSNNQLDDILQPKGINNVLEVKKTKGKLFVSLNDQLLHATPFEGLFGDMNGFIVNSNMKIAVEEISLFQGDLGSDELNVEGPKITWVTPVNKLTTTHDNFLTIEAGISAIQRLKKVQLFLNHELLNLVHTNNDFRSSVADFDEIIYKEVELLVGVNEIKIVAEDLNGERSISKRVVKLVADESQFIRKDRALLFATNEYDYWGNLVNPLFDAKTLAKELGDKYGFEVELIENPTTRDVMVKLKEYSKMTYKENDQLFVFFAGHGKYDKDFNQGFVVCKNSLVDDIGNISLISHDNLRTVINNIPSQHIFLMMDVCFGGTFDPSIGTGGHRGGMGGIYEDMSRNQYIREKLKYRTRKYLTSGGNEYVPDGTPGNHSPFARKVLEAMRSNGGEDKILTLSELNHYLERVRPTPRFGEFGNNEPGSDFMFIKK